MEPSNGVPSDTPPPPLSRTICGFWSRIWALFLDGLVLGSVGVVCGIFLFDAFAKLGGWGRLVGFGVALPYFGVLNSAVGGGMTIGKRIAKIEVVDAEGCHIPLARSFLRYLILGVPFFLNGARIETTWLLGYVGLVVGILVLGLGGSIVYLYVFNRRTRQSVHDLVVGTYVAAAGGSGHVVATPFWRPHLKICGAWCLALVALSLLSPRLMKIGPFPELLSCQQRIQASKKVLSASVFAGENWNYQNGTKTHTSSLQVAAVMRDRPDDYGAAANEIAAMVLSSFPAISKKDVLVVSVDYGYDIGIAHAWISRRFQHSPSEWESIAGNSR